METLFSREILANYQLGNYIILWFWKGKVTQLGKYIYGGLPFSENAPAWVNWSGEVGKGFPGRKRFS